MGMCRKDPGAMPEITPQGPQGPTGQPVEVRHLNEQERNREDRMNKGDKVITVYGKIETVMSANDAQVTTYESASRNEWYHPSKVWKVSNA